MTSIQSIHLCQQNLSRRTSPRASENAISGLLSIDRGILAGNVNEDLTQKVINTVHWQADTKSKFESTLLQLVRKYHLCQYLEEDTAKIFLQGPNNHSRSMPEISDRLWKRAMMRTICCRQIFCSIVFRASDFNLETVAQETAKVLRSMGL